MDDIGDNNSIGRGERSREIGPNYASATELTHKWHRDMLCAEHRMLTKSCGFGHYNGRLNRLQVPAAGIHLKEEIDQRVLIIGVHIRDGSEYRDARKTLELGKNSAYLLNSAFKEHTTVLLS